MKRDTTCVACGGKATLREDLTYEEERAGLMVAIPNLKGWRCSNCGEEYFPAETVRLIESILKRFEALPVAFERKVTLGSRGEAVIRLPKDLVKSMGLSGKERLIIKPISKKRLMIEVSA